MHYVLLKPHFTGVLVRYSGPIAPSSYCSYFFLVSKVPLLFEGLLATFSWSARNPCPFSLLFSPATRILNVPIPQSFLSTYITSSDL